MIVHRGIIIIPSERRDDSPGVWSLSAAKNILEREKMENNFENEKILEKNSFENSKKILEKNLKKNEKSGQTIENYSKFLRKFLESKLNYKDYAKTLKNKNQVSKLKNALIYSGVITKDTDKFKLDKVMSKKPKRRGQPKEQFNVKKFWMSINNCRNKKHKYPFRLSILSGLRIEELADLEKRDLTFLDDGRIRIHVRHGKGDKERIVTTIMKDKYLYDNLKEFLENKTDGDRVFYSKKYLHRIAKKHNFSNHDLRKACIQKIYYSCDMNTETTVELIQAYLGHSKGTRNYLYYLSRDINATNTKFDI